MTKTAHRCHIVNCKRPVTHTVQRLWRLPGREPFALQHCCDEHIPGSKADKHPFTKALLNHGKGLTPFYRVEKITDAA